MFLLAFLVPFVPFEIVTFIELILLVVTGYFYWQDQKEKEDRLRYLEGAERRRQERDEEEQRAKDGRKRIIPLKTVCGNCHLFFSAECERKETDSNAEICEHYLGRF